MYQEHNNYQLTNDDSEEGEPFYRGERESHPSLVTRGREVVEEEESDTTYITSSLTNTAGGQEVITLLLPLLGL